MHLGSTKRCQLRLYNNTLHLRGKGESVQGFEGETSPEWKVLGESLVTGSAAAPCL